MCPSRRYYSTIYLGNMGQRDKTNIFDNINEMQAVNAREHTVHVCPFTDGTIFLGNTSQRDKDY